MKPVIIIAIAFVLLIPATAYGAEGYFLNDFGKQVSEIPYVCIFQPNDSRIDEDRWKRWYSDAKIGIDSWKTMLKQSGGKYWDITVVEVPLYKLDLLNHSVCDITVEFVKKPFIENGYYANALGWWEIGTGTIKIVYSSFEFCGQEYNSDFDIIVHTYCFSDSLERSRQMANTVQHEFGHALGLGHYRGYDNSFTQSWYDTGVGAPSIMAFIQPNEEVRQVTQIDVEKIREIYGTLGFGKRVNSILIFNERIIPEPVIEVTEGGKIYLYEGERTTYTISGNVPDKLFKRGTVLEIIIQKPDGTTEYKGTTVSKTRHAYNYPLFFDYSFQSGRYEITLQFDGKIFSIEEIHVVKEQIKEQNQRDPFTQAEKELQNDKKMPVWIKNNAKWWADGFITDKEFTDGIEHLIEEKIMPISDNVKSRGSDYAVVPDWVKNNAKWWADGVIGDDEFLAGIHFLVEQGIIKVSLVYCPPGGVICVK